MQTKQATVLLPGSWTTGCVHYSGCQLWLALLLMSDEFDHPGVDIIVPDITKA